MCAVVCALLLCVCLPLSRGDEGGGVGVREGKEKDPLYDVSWHLHSEEGGAVVSKSIRWNQC